MHYSSLYESPLGTLTLACGEDEKNLIGLWFEGQKHFGGRLAAGLSRKDGVPLFGKVKAWLDKYFAGELPRADELPLAPTGSGFQKKVWTALTQIPYGKVTTYGEIAEGLTSSPRAVGGAVGRNPISIIIPCHRVVGAGGKMTGYAAGVEIKRKLLELEGFREREFFLA